MSLKNPKTLRKSPVSNACAAIFKNTDFSWSSSKVTKLSEFYLFFLLKLFSVSIIKKMTVIVSVKPI